MFLLMIILLPITIIVWMINWLDYQKVTGQDAHLSTLFINEETEEAAFEINFD